jgi:hypothetical protein
MYHLDAIEAINFEQLATATDRLLLHGGRLPRHRPSASQGASADGAPERTALMRAQRGGVHAPTILVSSVVTGALVGFATFAGLL